MTSAWAKTKTSLSQQRRLLKRSLEDRSLQRITDEDFQPVFICGIAGSGTTLLSALLDQNYRNALCLHESARMLETHPLLWMEKVNQYSSVSHYREDLYFPAGLSASRLRRAVLTTYRLLVDYPRQTSIVLDKAPNAHMVRIGKLLEAFPSARVIMIYRDPLEVLEGFIRKWPQPFAQSNLEELSAFYNDLHNQFINQTRHLEATAIIGLEALKGQTNTVIRSLAAMLGFQERSHEKAYRDRANKPGKGLRNVVNGKVRVDKKGLSKVDERFSHQQQEAIRAMTLDTVNLLRSLETPLVTAQMQQAAVSPDGAR